MAFFKDAIGKIYRNSQGQIIEKCSGSCLNEVMFQLAIIFGGKQVINQLLKFAVPSIMTVWNQKAIKEEREFLHEQHAASLSQKLNVTPSDATQNPRFFYPPQWNFYSKLDKYNGTSDDYHAMAIQFGFATLFATAFPIAPLFAVINNFFEIRSDAFFLASHLCNASSIQD